jgi:hypothetical protein
MVSWKDESRVKLSINNSKMTPFLIDDLKFNVELPENSVCDEVLPCVSGGYNFESCGWWYKIPLEELNEHKKQGKRIEVEFGGASESGKFATEVKYSIDL